MQIKVLERENGNEQVYDTKDKIKEEESKKYDKWHALYHGWAQFRPLFHKPYLMKVLLVTGIQFGTMMGYVKINKILLNQFDNFEI